MLLLVFLAQCIGKTYDMISAACFAMCLILAQSPMLLYHSGFQLSFGAVFAIGALGKYFTYYFSAQSSALQSILVSAAIQIVTFPIVLYHFFQYPVYGFFLNFLVIPLMSYVMVSGIAGICLGFIWLPAGKTALATGYYILKLYSCLLYTSVFSCRTNTSPSTNPHAIITNGRFISFLLLYNLNFFQIM